MNADELIQLATGIHEEAYWANNYWNIVLQHYKYLREYGEEINLSPAFHQIVRRSLLESMYMCLARIYDDNEKSLNIKRLLTECKSSLSLFPSQDTTTLTNQEGETETFVFPLTYELKSDEEWLFPEEVSKQKKMCLEMNLDYLGTRVNVTIEQLFEIYSKKYSALSKSLRSLRELRNKRYAHNDCSYNFDYERIFQNAPLYTEDVEKLIHYALDFCGYIVAALSGNILDTLPINISDWYATLETTRIGLLYQDEYLDKMYPET